MTELPAGLSERCDLLRALHVPGSPLVLPNAWDVPSARAVVAAGFPIVATTSGGVADALGYEDGEAAPPDEMFAAAARIARAVEAPVTMDAEAGYSLAPADLIEAFAGAGVAGCNLEDTDHSTGTLSDTERHAGRLAAIRAAASERGFGLVVNARVDVFLADRTTPQIELVDQAAARARTYLAAGADCVYPIFLRDPDAIDAFVRGAGGPVNILGQPAAPPRDELAALGVARISYGSSLHTRTMQRLTELLAEIPH
jgi:2-methylisocitrate lyase-like PEP mutase family enzyme